MMLALRTLAPCLALALAAACASSGGKAAKPMKPELAPAAVAEASAVIERGDAASLEELEEAVDALRSARVTPGLPPELRRDVQLELERGAVEMIRRSDDARALRDLVESELPMRLAARAGVRAAEILLSNGKRMQSFRAIRALDRRYPTHTQRIEAGDLLAQAGFSLADDGRRYWLIFRYASLAPQVLEYLALEYPTHEQTDDALVRLAEIYEGRKLWYDAIEKHRELVLWAPQSPFRPESEFAIPRLRLRAMPTPEYARDELLTARDELLDWLAAHPSHALVPDVERALVDARQRLADNDLMVARFYRTVKSLAGLRFHALRAQVEARLAGNAEQLAEAEALLADAIDMPAAVEVEEPTGETLPPDPAREIFEVGGAHGGNP